MSKSFLVVSDQTEESLKAFFANTNMAESITVIDSKVTGMPVTLGGSVKAQPMGAAGDPMQALFQRLGSIRDILNLLKSPAIIAGLAFIRDLAEQDWENADDTLIGLLVALGLGETAEKVKALIPTLIAVYDFIMQFVNQVHKQGGEPIVMQSINPIEQTPFVFRTRLQLAGEIRKRDKCGPFEAIFRARKVTHQQMKDTFIKACTAAGKPFPMEGIGENIMAFFKKAFEYIKEHPEVIIQFLSLLLMFI